MGSVLAMIAVVYVDSSWSLLENIVSSFFIFSLIKIGMFMLMESYLIKNKVQQNTTLNINLRFILTKSSI